MRSDRLLSLLLLLQSHGRLPAPELARRLEVSVRTVLRDVEALSAAGIPVYTERGRHGGIALLAGFRTDVTGMTADEARALFVLLTGDTHASLGLGAAAGSALRKIMAALPAPHREAADLVARRIIVDPVRWRTGASVVDLSTLQEAVFTDRRLRLRYRSGDAPAPAERVVDPYGLVEKAGVWYLVADRDGEPRLYRADRVVAAAVLDAPAQRRNTTLADEWEVLRARVDDFPARLTVRVRVAPAVLARFALMHRAELLSPVPADTAEPVELELRFAATAAARTLLAFGTDVTVLSPKSVVTDLAEVSAATAAHYAASR
ncbi:putative DNA-binding transcriptional regulator YafY [Catenuloplanes nepalensis]|uniref:DNA-binding transcriptional regulator YafY n=1 Tax=Catenuloplanes nepalensis TaxID=587533 RepID=A0ABT9MMU7_9ACTN|nr:WYL domain-containing protein [Catenuloplanes nepalensis]MDP9792737.1 putative DNA-binding transcriptional regulator YafY [Catenuloplanes nepalensis]